MARPLVLGVLVLVACVVQAADDAVQRQALPPPPPRLLLAATEWKQLQGRRLDVLESAHFVDELVQTGASVHGFRLLRRVARVGHSATALTPWLDDEPDSALVSGFSRSVAPYVRGSPPEDVGHMTPALHQRRYDGAVAVGNSAETPSAPLPDPERFALFIPAYDALDGILWPPTESSADPHEVPGFDRSTPPLYHLQSQVGHGAQGEVWRAVLLNDHGEPDFSTGYVLKRLFAHKPEALLSGAREAVLGTHLAQHCGEGHQCAVLGTTLARFHAHFERLVHAAGHWDRPRPGARGDVRPPPPSTSITPIDPADSSALARALVVALDEGQWAGEQWTGAGQQPLLPLALPGVTDVAAPGGDGAAGERAQPGRGEDDGPEHTENTNRQLELWLVFRDEGHSLQQLLYAGGGGLLSPGPLLRRLWSASRVSAQTTVAACMFQALAAAQALLELGVQHRDIKPGNVFVAPTPEQGEAEGAPSNPALAAARRVSGVTLRLGDLGSALHLRMPGARELFGARGPSDWDTTTPYAAPEVLMGQQYPLAAACIARTTTETHLQQCVGDMHWPVPRLWPPGAYDAWSLGVMLLDLVLAPPLAGHRVHPPPPAVALLDARLAEASENTHTQVFRAVQGAVDAGRLGAEKAAAVLDSIAVGASLRRQQLSQLHTWVHLRAVPLARVDALAAEACGGAALQTQLDGLLRLGVEGALLDAGLEAVLRGHTQCALLSSFTATLRSTPYSLAVGQSRAPQHHTGWNATLEALREVAWKVACDQRGSTPHRPGHRHTQEATEGAPPLASGLVGGGWLASPHIQTGWQGDVSNGSWGGAQEDGASPAPEQRFVTLGHRGGPGSGRRGRRVRRRADTAPACETVPLAELRRPVALLGQAGEEALRHLLQPDPAQRLVERAAEVLREGGWREAGNPPRETP